MRILIKRGRVIDPANNRDGIFDILVAGGKISEIGRNITAKAGLIIDAKDKIVTPGFIDMHVHLREPGREDIETVASGTRSAVSGGITSVCAMPNTSPAIDTVEKVRLLKNIIKKDAVCDVFIAAAVTESRSGARVVDMEAMKKEGVVAVSDDGNSVQDGSVMFEALKKAKESDLLLISHCEDKSVSRNGVINDGIMATKLGLRGMPKKAEYEFVRRDIELAKKTKARLHIAHVSCRESVDIIKKAKKEGVRVTAECTPHHFTLDETSCADYDTRTKMNPPLRSQEDVEALKNGLKDGTIDAIASDHAPHGKHEKEIVFDNAAFGIIGLETSFALALMNLVRKKLISWQRLVELMSANPAAILGLERKGALSPGNDADIAIIDPQEEWVYTRDAVRSKSKNSPFINWRFKGRVTGVIAGGRFLR